ncbi:MAG: branched-chain amino acid ABC transporter permease [Burkholderiaceae bacterium]|jgi:branched-chain amino acid transport system permease protein|nr:branched-chain amino acid ABC transporter permease [Burkholderiaceae bacterium]MEB2317386.1 branched-chain amino acid ABC transporter permease [Pseudomonadota bacterium]
MLRNVILAAVIAAAVFFPMWVTVNYFVHLAVLAMVFMIVAQSANLIQGYTGYVSIAQGGFMGVGAYASALLSVDAGWPVWLSIAVAPLVTGITALIAGYPSLRVKGHYFAIVTMALNMVVFIVLVNWMQVTGGEGGYPGIPMPEPIGFGDWAIAVDSRIAMYYIVLAALLLVMAAMAAVVRSRVGRVLMAIRQNETFAESAGIATWKYKLFAFTASGMLAGFAGALYAHYMGFLSPNPFSVDASLNAILAVILGGSGTLSGPLVGALLTVLLPEVLRVAEIFRLIVYGLLLVIVMIFLPHGLVPALVDRLSRLRRVRTAEVPAMKEGG